jgi:hypothetical protein
MNAITTLWRREWTERIQVFDLLGNLGLGIGGQVVPAFLVFVNITA